MPRTLTKQTKHKIKKNETVSGICKSYGVKDWKGVWDDPANKKLKSSRKKPESIQPGDQLVLNPPGPDAKDIKDVYKRQGKKERVTTVHKGAKNSCEFTTVSMKSESDVLADPSSATFWDKLMEVASGGLNPWLTGSFLNAVGQFHDEMSKKETPTDEIVWGHVKTCLLYTSLISELKICKKNKKRNFLFAAGSKIDDHYLELSKKKIPRSKAKDAKKAAGAPKAYAEMCIRDSSWVVASDEDDDDEDFVDDDYDDEEEDYEDPDFFDDEEDEDDEEEEDDDDDL